ncbi:MAG: alpha/beta hydrolase family protein [Promethearchaeota archaeon]
MKNNSKINDNGLEDMFKTRNKDKGETKRKAKGALKYFKTHKKLKYALISVSLIILIVGGIGLTYFYKIYSIKYLSFSIYSKVPDPDTQPQFWETDYNISLDSRLYLPPNFDKLNHSGNKFYGAVMFHGLGRDLNDNDYFARLLAQKGVVVLCISSRGHGESGGSIPVNKNETFADAYAAFEYLKNQTYINSSKILAHGTSMGGAQALFLSMHNFADTFVVWFPAIGYYDCSTPLYQEKNSKMKGLICAGTADQCSSCIPQYNTEFIKNNPNVDIIWLNNATHTDSRFFMSNVENSINWLEENWF